MKFNFSTFTKVLVVLLICGNASLKVKAEPGIVYSAHTHMPEINHMKKRSLRWHEDNFDKKKDYFIEYVPNYHVGDKDSAYLKRRALKWHENNVDKKKDYFIEYFPNHHVADREIKHLKDRGLKWYERDSWTPTTK